MNMLENKLTARAQVAKRCQNLLNALNEPFKQCHDAKGFVKETWLLSTTVVYTLQ